MFAGFQKRKATCLVARAGCVVGYLVLPARDRWNKECHPRSPAGLGMPDQCL